MRPEPSSDLPASPPRRNETISELQFLRLVAAVMVLVSHLQHQVKDRKFLLSADYVPFEPVFWAGGVDIFFVISGFIMYHLSRDEFGRPGASALFVQRRLVRIVPPYWLCTIAMLVALVVFRDHIKHSDPSLLQIVGSFTFIPFADPYGTYYPILILGWTLNFEMLFYVVFAIGLLMPRRAGVAFIILVISVIGLAPYFVRIKQAPFGFWCNPIVFEFLFGMALAHIRSQGVRVHALTGWGIALFGFALMVIAKMSGLVHFIGPWRPIWMGVPALVVCAGLALIREPEAGHTGRVWRWLILGGNASFALYLTHPFAINAVSIVFSKSGIRSPEMFVAVALAVSMVVALVTHILIEQPIHDALRRRIGKASASRSRHAPA
mgnify:CR=1 FL=1